jgi:DNA topoisomerase IB
MLADLKVASLEPTKPEHLKIRRVRRGAGFAYVQANGRNIRERTIIRRLERLAVPPAYQALAVGDFVCRSVGAGRKLARLF